MPETWIPNPEFDKASKMEGGFHDPDWNKPIKVGRMPLLGPRNTSLWSLGKTNTFRAASSAVFENKYIGFDGYGTNTQNITNHLRRIYVPSLPGYKLGGPDQSGAEAMIVAYLCRPGKYRDLFIYGIKPHSYTALHLFEHYGKIWSTLYPDMDIQGMINCCPRDLPTHPHWQSVAKTIKSSDEWPAKERYYYMAKQTCHSANFGIRAPTLALNTLEKSDGKVALSQRDAEYFLSFYRSTFPEIVEWNIEVWEQYNKTHTLFNLFGHPREFIGDDKENEVYAFIPQSTVGEITHVAIREVQEYINFHEKEWNILVNTHDGFLLEFPEEEEEEARVTSCAAIEQELQSPDGTIFNMKSEWKCGMNWMDMH